MVRYVHPGEELAVQIKQGIRAADVANTASGTEKLRTSQVAQLAWDQSEFAKGLAEQLEVELGEANIELGQALADSAAALAEAGLARGDAATAVSDAQAAVAEAEQAILDAAAASGAASVADGKAVAAQSVAQSAQDDADAAVLAADAAASVAAAAGSDATDALADAETARLAAVAAQAKADQAFIDAADAATAAGNAQTSANGKNRVWYQGTAPAGTGHKAGDTWFDTSNGNRVTQWDGDSWEVTQFGTGAIATAAITNALIADATIQSAKIANLDAAKITTGTLDAARIAALSISTGHLAADAVTAAKIAALTITAAEIATNAVTAIKIAADAVTAEKINAGAVTTVKLDALAVTAEKIAAGAIIADKIAANAITTAKLAATAIDGMTITGALIRTAASGQRMQFDVDGLKSFSSLGVLTSVLSAFNGRFLLSSIADSSGLELTPEAIWLKDGSSIHGALGKYGLQVYPTPGLSAQYVSDRAFVRKEVIHPTSGAATNRVEMNGGSDGYVSISAAIDTDSGSVRNTSAELSASFDSSGVPYSRATADVGLFNELRTFVNPTDPTTGSSPLNVNVSAGFAVNSKLVAGDALRGNAAKMNALHSDGLAYDGLKFWRTDLNVPYIYIGGVWAPYGEQALNLSTITVRTGYTIQGGSWAQKRSDGFVRGLLIVKRNSGAISGDTNGVALLTLPTGWRPSGTWEGSCATSQGGTAAINFGQITSGGDCRAWNATVNNQQAAWQFEFMAA